MRRKLMQLASGMRQGGARVWLVAAALTLALPLPAVAVASETLELDGLLATLASARVPDGRGAEASAARRLATLLPPLEQRYASTRAGFDLVARRALPAKAAERLARARAAHAAGQGRLVEVLRRLAHAPGAGVLENERAALAQEARDILGRIAAASRQEPLSAELKVRAPVLESLPLPVASGSAPEPEGAIGSVPPALRTLAESFAGPIEAYAWVRNNVRPEFYYGSLKGPLQTLLERAGNDADSAALLIALLRAKGLPARFVQGTVQVDVARLVAVTGAGTAEQAVRVLERAGIPHEPVLGPAGVTAVKLARVWAEAYVPYANYRGLPADAQGRLWLPLDPGFKDLRAPGGLDVVAELGLDPSALADEYLAAPRSQTPREFVRQRVSELLASRGLAYEQALNDRSLLPEDLGILPNALPYAVVGATDAGFDAPLQHRLHVVGEHAGTLLIDATLPLQDVLGQRLTLSYVPFDADDAAVVAQYGGLPATPPYLIEVKPVLKAGGVVVAVGQAPVGMAVKYDLRVELAFPGGHEEVRNSVLAGNLTAIGLAGGQAGGYEPQSQYAAALLARAAFDYLRSWSRSDAELADLFRVVPVRPTASACFVMSDIEVEYAGGDPLYPLSFDWKGVAIDADLRPAAPVGVEERAQEPRFTLLSGLEGSVLEHRLFEDLWEVGSVSTAKALQLAAQQGASVLTITRDNVETDLPGLPLDEGVKAEIRDAALRGFVVRVPGARVSHLAWTGSGWWVLDPDTGESAWQLQGGHSGGVTAAAVIDWPSSPLVEKLIDQGEEPAPVGSEVARIVKFVSTDFQDGVVDKTLGRPFRVLVTNAEGQRVPRAVVTFRVLGGGGSLIDPATGLPGGSFVVLLSNDRGEAEATLVLGKSTSEIPRFACLQADPESCSAENEIWATQVGLNLVTASSGEAQLAEPFTAYARPDDRFDGTYIYAKLSFKVLPSGGGVSNLSVAGLLAINTRDQHGNPLSNFPVRFAYRPPPVLGTPPEGWQVARGVTQTPGKLLRLGDYERCLEQTPSPRWGDCPGEQEELLVRSSSYGSVSYPVLGDSPYSRYYFDIGTNVEPVMGYVEIGTWGKICWPNCDAWWGRWPITLVDIDSRPVLAGPTGNLIEAYAPGASADMAFSAQALYEGYELEPFVDDQGNKRYRVHGTNQWTREPLDDTVFTLTPRSAGTGAPGTAAYSGNGTYAAPMRLADTPQLNIVDYEAGSTPWLIPQYLPDHRDEVDPSAVDETTLQVAKRKFPDTPNVQRGAAALWGVRAAILGVEPAPVRVEDGHVAQLALVSHSVEPPGYLAELAPTNLWFTLSRNDDLVLAAAGTDGSPFEIPRGLNFPPGDYTARLSIPGVSWGGGGIESAPFPIQACQPLELLTPSVVLPLNPNPGQQSACQVEDKIRFRICGRSAVTLTVTGSVLTARVDGILRTLDALELQAGEHVVEVPRELVESFQQPVVPFLVHAVALDPPALVRDAPGAVSIADELITLATPVVSLDLTVDRDNGLKCGDIAPLVFAVCDAARVTVKLDGSVLSAAIDDGPIIPLDGLTLAAGRHTVTLQPDLLSWSYESQKPFRIEAQSVADPQLQDTADGLVKSKTTNRSILPVGHTFVKGVDLFDGHVVRAETDLSLPGRHLGLEMSRTYSSSSSDPESVMGAGWNWIYGMSLHVSSCGLVVLTTRDGTQMFASSDGGQTYTPQKGYHGRLVRNADGTFDYFDKSNVQHRFAWPTVDLNDLRLEWMREPHGDRLVLNYDLPGRVTKVVQEQDGAPVHELRLTYAKARGFDRIQRAEIVKAGGGDLGLAVDYVYDPQWGNLDRATRPGRNIDGGPRARDREQHYRYSVTSTRDQHQLTEVVDANQHVTRYQYYARTDTLPGEESQTFFVLDKEERVKVVYEYPDLRELGTRFNYDLTEAISLRWKTTVTDPALRDTLYVQNGNGSTTEIHEPLGRDTLTTWYPDVRKETETDANQRLTRFAWDARGNPLGETIETGDPDLGDVATGTLYDATYSKLVSKTDGEGHTTSWTLNPDNGDVVSLADAEGNATTYEYDGGSTSGPGLLTGTTDARGNAVTFEQHDDFGQPRRVRDALGNRTQKIYDDRGRLTLETDSFGRRTEYQYDGLDRLTLMRRQAESGSDDEVTQKDYYADGQLLSETNANGAKTVYTLDGLNRVTDTATYLTGRVLRSAAHYDNAGNKETETDVRGVRRRFVYDALNRLRQVRIEGGPAANPTGEVASFDYDLVGNKKWEKDQAGLQTDFFYDGLYRVKTRRLPEQMSAGYSPTGPLEEHYRYDKAGNRLSVHDPNGHETRFAYDRTNRLKTTVQDPGGLGLTTTVRYCNAPAPDPPDGMGLNKCEVHETPKGLRTLFEYDELNREKKRTVRLEGPDGDPAVDQYVTETTYDDDAHAVRVKDPNLNVMLTELDGLDRPIRQVVDEGELSLETKTFYDGLGNKKLVLDPRGNRTKARYDGLGRLTLQTDARNASSSYDYDGGGLRTLEVDRRLVRKRFEYDNLGRQVRAFLENTPYSGKAWSQTSDYRDRDRLRVETDARGKTTTSRLDGLDRVIEETDHRGQTAFSTWDGVNKRRQTDKRPAHHATDFEYDAINRLTRTLDPPAPTLRFEATTHHLDAANQVEESDRRATVKLTQLDALGRVRSVTRAVGQTDVAVLERNTYDGNGNKTVALDAEDHRTEFTYDGANRLSARLDGVGTPEARTTRYQYDAGGNQEIEQDQRARDLGQPFSVKRTFDALNRLTDVYDGEGDHTVYDYDAEGNRKLVQEPKAQSTRFAYDELGKLLTVTQPSTAAGIPVTGHAYDENRNRTRQTDARQHALAMEYDDLDRLEWSIQEGDRRTRHEYDENGNEERLTDPNGHVVKNTFDELNRLRVKDYVYAAGLELPWRRPVKVEYDYDGNGNLTDIRTTVASGTDPPASTVVLTTTRVYDRLDRLISEAGTTAYGQTTGVAFSYFRNGLRRSATDTAGAVTQYEYDGQNRLQSVKTDAGTPDERVTTYTYWPDDLVREVSSPNGVKASHFYDKADRLKNLTNTRGGTVVSSFGYDYDPNGNRERQVEVNGGLTETTTYGYDALNRLERVSYPADTAHPGGRTLTYGYDLVGNRQLEREVDGSGTARSNKVATFDALDRLTSVDDTVDDTNDAAFTYDDSGNLRTKATGGVTTTYVYDAVDRLSEVRDSAHPAPLARFQYDAEGRRILKIGDPTAPGDSGTRQFVYDQTAVLQELDAAGVPVAKYEWGGDRLVSLGRREGGLLQRRYYSFDALGSVTNLTDDSGAARASYHLDAWGNFRFPSELEPAGDSLAASNRFSFTGHYFDTETKLYYAKARYFDPNFGRFLTQDTYLGELSDPPSLHRYLYANANPTRYVDPTGHWSWEGFVEGLKGVPRAIAEPVFWIQDTVLAIGAYKYDIPTEYLPLKSALAQRQLARVEEGQSGGKAALKGAIETPAAVLTLGTTAFAQGQYEAYQDFSSGTITLDEYDRRLSQMAGGQTGAAVLGATLSRASGRTWTGRAPAVPDEPFVNLTPEAQALGEFASEAPPGAFGSDPGPAVPFAPRAGAGSPRHADFQGPWRQAPGEDFKWKPYLAEETGTKPPPDMPDPHAHHILAKRGRPSQRALVEEGQEILRRRGGIDPIFGKPNLTWAPNRVPRQHSTATIRSIVEGLRELDKADAPPDAFARLLEEQGKVAAQRR